MKHMLCCLVAFLALSACGMEYGQAHERVSVDSRSPQEIVDSTKITISPEVAMPNAFTVAAPESALDLRYNASSPSVSVDAQIAELQWRNKTTGLWEDAPPDAIGNGLYVNKYPEGMTLSAGHPSRLKVVLKPMYADAVGPSIVRAYCIGD